MLRWGDDKPVVSETVLTLLAFALFMFLWGALFGWLAHLTYAALT